MSERKITLRQITDYSKCPKYAKYSIEAGSQEKSSEEFRLFHKIVKSVYKDMQNLQTIPTWPTVRTRVSREVMGAIEVPTVRAIESSYKTTMALMGVVQKWYSQLVSGFPGEVLINLNLSADIKPGLSIEGTVDALMLWQDDATLVVFSDEHRTSLPESFFATLDLKTRGLVWLLDKQGIQVTECIHVVLKYPEVDIIRFKVDNNLVKTQETLQLITAGIYNGIYFPSVTPACEMCPFKGICKW